MNHRNWSVGLLVLALAVGLLAGGAASFTTGAAAQSSEARCVRNACVANGLAYQYILRRKSTFYAWYDTAYRLTGCGDSGWVTVGQLLLDVASEFLDAPGAYTMQCWQMMLGQASVCGDQCNAFFVKDCAYAPNVRATLGDAQAGYFAVTVDNNHSMGGLPEYEPSAYSRKFSSYSYVQREGGQKLLVDKVDLPSLSYPNWVTDAAYTECVQQYDDTRCTIIASFLTPSETSYEVTWGGGLYDLTGLTKNAGGLDSQPSSGYIALKSDGDRVTVNQGPYAGFLYSWEHNNETGKDAETLTPWNAYGGDVTFHNSECNCNWCFCNVTQVSRNRDSYVYMSEGPPDRLFTGDYAVQVEARLFHDKDISDNNASYSYHLDVPPPTPTPGPTAVPTAAPTVMDIVPGTYQGRIETNETNDVYRFQVPAGVPLVRARLTVPSGADFDLIVTPGQPPDPYNLYCSDCPGCLSAAATGAPETCSLYSPSPGAYYLLVHKWYETGPYTLTLEFVYPTPTAIRTATPTATGTAAPTRTATPPATALATAAPTATNPPGVRPSVTPNATATPGSPLSEQEPNDSFDAATQWPLGGPMRGRLSSEGDKDYFSFTTTAPAIYTVHLDGVSADIAPDLAIYQANRTTVVSEYSATKGESIALSFDANPGETFYLRVKASYASQTSDQPYTLSVTSIADLSEPNDDFSQATPWDFASGPIQGYFWEAASGPSDYYAFTVPPSPGSVLLSVHLTGAAANIAPDLTLYNQSHINVASEYSAQPGESVSLTIDANAGEVYFVRVKPSYATRTSEQPYTLDVTTVPDPAEPNDDFSQATPWDFTSGPIQGYFWEAVSGPSDYYTFTVPGSGGTTQLTVNLTGVAPNIAPDLTIYNQNHVNVATEYSAQPGESVTLSFLAQQGGQYFVRVKPSYATHTSAQPYTLTGSSSGGGG